MDVPGLRRHALDEIRRFEEQARASGVSNEIVLSARYALCAGLDEAVLSTPWGDQSEWAQHPLLVALHREAWGGEKFFDMLDRISQDPARYIDLMELQYLCLAFGFAGKYQVQERGQEHLPDVQQDLYRKIRELSGPAGAGAVAALARPGGSAQSARSATSRGGSSAPRRCRSSPIAFTVYYASLAGLAAPVHAELAKVGAGGLFAAAARPVPVRGPTLKQLLAADERSGVLSVEENGNRTMVTLLARDLFPSGSATVNPAYDDALERITEALEQGAGPRAGGRTHRRSADPVAPLPGQLRAVARARRRASSTVLQKGIDNRARLTWTGVGCVGAALPARVGSGEPGAQSAGGNHPRARHLRARR